MGIGVLRRMLRDLDVISQCLLSSIIVSCVGVGVGGGGGGYRKWYWNGVVLIEKVKLREGGRKRERGHRERARQGRTEK